MSDASKLLAIGLLNLADDEGYFFADPRMVRNALRPMDDDSGIATVSLRELSEIGYISVKKHPSHGDIAKIESFLSHQVINKPKPSTIKELYDYGSATGAIPEGYRLEGKGMEGNREWSGTGEKKKKTPSAQKGKTESREEFDDHFKASGLYPRDAEYAWLHWNENGWKNGSSAIKDWKMTVAKWKTGGFFPTQKTPMQPETGWNGKSRDLTKAPKPPEIPAPCGWEQIYEPMDDRAYYDPDGAYQAPEWSQLTSKEKAAVIAASNP
jgi:hypothetical protein